MRLVVIASPFRGNVDQNLIYGRECLRDSLLRGEAPIGGHLLYTQTGVLDDENATERMFGMAAGHEWIKVADALVVYTDFGITSGMLGDIAVAEAEDIKVEYRTIEGPSHAVHQES